MTGDFATDGFAVVESVLAPAELEALRALPSPAAAAGRRGLLAFPSVAAVARSPHLLALVRPHLRGEPRPVRAILFDKTPETNWLVPWHQDLSVAVREKVDGLAGFGPWSIKDGIPHVQPPVASLEQMVTLRLHLDAADADNGALRVLPATHTLGRLSPDQIRELRNQRPEVLCPVPAAGALLMHPLLLHASSRSIHHLPPPRRPPRIRRLRPPRRNGVGGVNLSYREITVSSCETRPNVRRPRSGDILVAVYSARSAKFCEVHKRITYLHFTPSA